MDEINIRISESVFESAFKEYYKALHAYACTILNNSEDAEEIVQQMFYKLWMKRENVNITQSLQAYLYRTVYHDCLNFLKHEKVKQAHQSYVLHSTQEADSDVKNLAVKELQEKIRAALNKLPEQCRTIFQLSRYEELKYKEIASRLNLSVKTIENQMGKALKIMRAELADYLFVFIWITSLFLFF